MTILNCGGNVGGSGLPDPTSASAGDVLTLDSNKDAVWQAPSGGATIENLSDLNSNLRLAINKWCENAKKGDFIVLRDINVINPSNSNIYSVICYYMCMVDNNGNITTDPTVATGYRFACVGTVNNSGSILFPFRFESFISLNYTAFTCHNSNNGVNSLTVYSASSIENTGVIGAYGVKF